MTSSTHRMKGGPGRFWIRLIWQWHHAGGWRIEGPFPNAHEPRLLLLGPGLDRLGPWSRFIEMRIGHRCIWWGPSMEAPVGLHVLSCYERDGATEMLEWAGQCGLQVHLVQKDDRHRRIRCNTPILAGRNPSRLKGYIDRVFSYST